MRIPLLSDLAGKKITGADLVAFFDPEDGPAVKGFLAFVNELYHLVDLVDQATSEGPIQLNFGDMIIVETGGGGGYGPPLERPRELIERDLRRGYVSVEAVERDYCVKVSL